MINVRIQGNQRRKKRKEKAKKRQKEEKETKRAAKLWRENCINAITNF